MAIADFQMKYNGLVFGLDTDIGITDVTGFDDLDVGLGDSPIPRGDGDVPGLSRAKARDIQLTLRAKGEKRSDELANTILDAFAAFSMRNEPLPLYLKDPGFEEVFVYARPIGRVMGRKPTTTFGSTPLVIRMKAADPRIYSTVEKAHTLYEFSASGGGLDYNVDYGKEFVGAGSGLATLVNDGNGNAYPLLRFYGPTSGTVTGVTLTNLTTGQTLVINSTILTGQTLTADMRRMIAADPTDVPYINLDGSTRYGDWQLPRVPFYLAPGSNSIKYEITGTSTDAPCVINYRSTWL